MANFQSDSERWQTEIECEYQRRLKNYPNQALEWRLLYSPRCVLTGAKVAFIGLNPGGSFVDPKHGKFSCEGGSAYRKCVENWGPRSGLQNQVISLFQRLEVVPEDVLAGNLVPFRSPCESSLAGAVEAIEFGKNLWKEILGKASPRIVITMGGTANRAVSSVLRVRGTETVGVGWGGLRHRGAVLTGGHGSVCPIYPGI